MQRLLLLLALAVAAPAQAEEQAAPEAKAPALEVEALGDGLHRISGSEAGCVLVLQSPRGMLLVDTGDAKEAEALDAILFELGKMRIHSIVNSHYHFDHIGGNARLGKDTRIVAHANVWAQAKKDTTIPEWGDWHREPAPAGARPTEALEDSTTLHVSGVPVVLWHMPNAHTDGDLVTWFPTHNVLHTGDIVEIGAPPFIDWWAGGSLEGMIAACDKLLNMADKETKIVPGHGDVITWLQLRDYRNMLADIGKRADEAVANGVSMEKWLETRPAAAYEEQVGGERRARRLAALIYYGANGMKLE